MRDKLQNNGRSSQPWRSLLLLGLLLALGGGLNRAVAQPIAVTEDAVKGYPAQLLGGAIWSADSPFGGATNYSIDLGPNGTGACLFTTNAAFLTALNAGLTNDTFAFSFWERRYVFGTAHPNASSAIWANSPDSATGGRGINAHVPWSDDTVYFDTDGCCNAGQTRISSPISALPTYNDDPDFWPAWHHFVFLKNGTDKQIWIDAQLFLDGTAEDTNGLSLRVPSDINSLNLGGYSGTGFEEGIIAQIAIFGNALTNGVDITNLFMGVSPLALPKSDNLVAYFDFHDANTAPLLPQSVVGTAVGFSFTVNLFGTNEVSPSSVVVDLNGTAVTPVLATTSPTNMVGDTNISTLISYTLPSGTFPQGSTQTVVLSLKSTSGYVIAPFTNTFVVAPYITIPASLILPAGSYQTNVHGFQILTYQADGTNGAFGGTTNPAPPLSLAGQDGILAGLYGPNVASTNDLDDQLENFIFTAPNGYFLWTNYLNFDITTPDTAADFNADNNYNQYAFPGIPGNVVNNLPATQNFVCDVFTAIQFPSAGLYTMGVSSDDNFTTFVGLDPMNQTSTNTLALGAFEAGGRGAADTDFQFYISTPGVYGFNTLYSQGGGGAVLEWFMISNGVKTLLNDVTNSLVVYPWIPTSTAAYISYQSPEPASFGFSTTNGVVQVEITDGANPIATSSISLSIDGQAVKAVVSKTNGISTVSYTFTNTLAFGAVETAALVYEDGTTEVTNTWSFTATLITYDSVSNFVGVLVGSSVFTPNGGGHTGKLGDYAIDLGQSGNPAGVMEATAGNDFLNAGGALDTMTVSLWVKRYNIDNSSVYWANSPTVGRAWNAHTPWSDDTVYWDTSGCCAAGTQRIDAGIATLTNSAGVKQYTSDTQFWFTQWHNFVFVKNTGYKAIFIDGNFFVDNSPQGSNATALATDITDMLFGGVPPDGGGGDYTQGLIDDFAFFDTPLSLNEITQLATGTSPSALAATNLLVAYWGFNDPPTNSTVHVTGPSISISGVVAGKATITFSGSKLLSSTTANGTFTVVTGATSPYAVTIPSTAGALFYRTEQ